MDGDILDMKELERQMNQLVDRTYVEEMLKIQLSEFEMLQSMFSNPGELCIDDASVLDHVSVNLPLEYPNFEPDVFVRSDAMNRTQQGLINSDLSSYISSLDRGDICIGSVIAWLQENASEYFDKSSSLDDSEKESSISTSSSNAMTRFWIYSHHIYSKTKRREILDLASEYNLTGFCLPGRPGIICIEGFSSDCEDWWSKIKSMNWKRIMLKKMEKVDLEDGKVDGFRKFSNFSEISFDCKGKGRDFHMDFGEFFKYLSAHGCDYMFKEYFGVEGK